MSHTIKHGLLQQLLHLETIYKHCEAINDMKPSAALHVSGINQV